MQIVLVRVRPGAPSYAFRFGWLRQSLSWRRLSRQSPFGRRRTLREMLAGRFDRMTDYLAIARKDPPLTAAVVVAGVGALTLCAVFFFQYGLLLAPCPLCLEQGLADYFCVPL